MKNGVLASYRDKFVFLKQGFLKDEELVAYDYFIHLADFDENHDKFGTFERLTNEVLGSGLGWSGDKLRRNLNALLNKGMLKLKNKKVIEVVGFSIYLPKYAFRQKKSDEYLSGLFAEVRSENAKMLIQKADLLKSDGDLATKSTVISDIGSYKVNTSYQRSKKEYDLVVEEGNYKYLTADDMRWLDINY